MTEALLALAFSAGALAFAAPCAYPLLPGYVAYFVGASGDGNAATPDGGASAVDGSAAAADGSAAAVDEPALSTAAARDRGSTGGGWLTSRVGEDGPSIRQATLVAAVTGFGATVVFAVFAVLVALLGAGVAGFAGELELAVGVLVALAGVVVASGRANGMVSIDLAERSRSPLGFFAFGVTYGVAAAGCSAPVFVGISLAGVSRGPVVAAAVVATYALGLVLALTAITLAAAMGHDRLLDRIGRGTGRITRLAGGLLVVAGLAQIHYAITVAGVLG